MRPSARKREHNRFIHICTPPERPLEEDVEREIRERIAQGNITRCPTGARVTKGTPERRHRYTPVFTRMSGKVT